MISIIDGRGTGKTNRLLLLAKEYNGTIVTAHPNFLKQRANNYGLTDIKVMGFHEFLTRCNNSKDSEVYLIDELEYLLKILNNNIIAYTISQE